MSSLSSVNVEFLYSYLIFFWMSFFLKSSMFPLTRYCFASFVCSNMLLDLTEKEGAVIVEDIECVLCSDFTKNQDIRYKKINKK